MRIRSLFLLLGVIWLSAPANAASVSIRILDGSKAGFPEVLIIVKSLEGKGELARALTDLDGRVPMHVFAPGLYRLIATCPYGICETKVSEFLVRDQPVQLELIVAIPPIGHPVKINGLVDVIGNVEIGSLQQLTIQLLDAKDQPLASTALLVRNADATDERWYRTTNKGESVVELPPAGALTFLVFHNDKLYPQTYGNTELEAALAKGGKLSIRID